MVPCPEVSLLSSFLCAILGHWFIVNQKPKCWHKIKSMFNRMLSLCGMKKTTFCLGGVPNMEIKLDLGAAQVLGSKKDVLV